MKKIGDIMQELGFNQEAPNSAKEAFIRHLVKAATGVELQRRKIPAPEPTKDGDKRQLSFDLDASVTSKKAI